jgi:hypothetical protein
MATTYQHRGRSATEQRRRSSAAVPAVAPVYTRCECGALTTVANLRDFGCRVCGRRS